MVPLLKVTSLANFVRPFSSVSYVEASEPVSTAAVVGSVFRPSGVMRVVASMPAFSSAVVGALMLAMAVHQATRTWPSPMTSDMCPPGHVEAPGRRRGGGDGQGQIRRAATVTEVVEE